jgi:hypothetical protein
MKIRKIAKTEIEYNIGVDEFCDDSKRRIAFFY